MPLHAYLKATIERGPAIQGAGTQDDRKGEVPVIAARHQVKSDISVESGMPLDTRTFGTFVITKKIDQGSPYFQQALRDNVPFSSWALRFFHMPSSGSEFNYAAVTLTGAKVVSIKMIMPHITMPGNTMIHEYEEIAFQYEGIGTSFTKHPSDASTSGNEASHGDVECIQGTDWFEGEAKALLLGLPKLIWQAKKIMWAEWQKSNPDKQVPDEFKE